MNWTKITNNQRVITLLKKRQKIEEEIREIEENALIMYELEVLSIPNVVGQSEQLKAVQKLKDFAYEVCPLHREDDLEKIIGSL